MTVATGVNRAGAWATPNEFLNYYASNVTSPDDAITGAAIERLRNARDAGYQALLEVHADTLKRMDTAAAASAGAKGTEEVERLKIALDAVGHQHDNLASRLYWHTDLESAKRAARASGRPILSLRLPGNLDDDLSCANGRFFRTILYANAAISRHLRENFVLHWKSVRPAARVTVDFGDGRKLERTLTGNGVHYILDLNGQVVDALPGLYGPQAFLRGLRRAETVARNSTTVKTGVRDALLRQYHRARADALDAELAADLQNLNGCETTRPANHVNPSVTASLVDHATWVRIAALHSQDATLDAGAKAIIRDRNPDVFAAGQVAVSERVVEDPLLRLVTNLEASIAQDTVRNEYLRHGQIHRWMAEGLAPTEPDALNAKVYAELFLTPDSDPWLGLAPSDTFSGLQNNGLLLSLRL